MQSSSEEKNYMHTHAYTHAYTTHTHAHIHARKYNDIDF